MKLQGKQHVHKSVDVSLRKFLQVTLFVLIMSKYLGLLHCKWSGVFLFLCSDSQIRRKPIRKVSAVWLASHGHKRERKEPPSLPPASVENKKLCEPAALQGRTSPEPHHCSGPWHWDGRMQMRRNSQCTLARKQSISSRLKKKKAYKSTRELESC